ncbi:MAG: aspartate aminotransferase family protein [Anaerolineae bacterium]
MTTTTVRTSPRERYQALNPKSEHAYQRALRSLPGGNSRTTIYFQPYPVYFERGAGCRVHDIDGNERIDFINNYTSLILGHAHPAVVEAVQRQVSRLASAAAPTELEVELAETIKERVPSMELLRFTNSGTEATMMAMRVARAFTGREKIAKFDGGYHGTHDYAAASVSAAGATGAGTETRAAGLPEAVAETMIIMPFNDKEATERIIEAHQDELAAVIVEPVMGAAGVVIPHDGFLDFLRQITEKWGILLIFDEVISFRISYHGAQGYFGVKPDLTTLGKIIGGGFPVGAFGGRADIMGRFDPRSTNYIGHGGTFNANPVTMTAGLATLKEMTPARYKHLNTLGAELKQKLDDLFEELQLSAQVNQIGSLFNIHLTDKPVRNYADVLAGNREALNELYVAGLNRGVAFTGRGMGCLSTPMTEAELDTFVDAVRLGLEELDLT